MKKSPRKLKMEEESKIEEQLPLVPFVTDRCSETDQQLGCYPGTIWKHYKGEEYLVVTTALHTENKVIMIVYQNIRTRKVFTRPASMWLEIVKPDGTTRFTLMREKV